MNKGNTLERPAAMAEDWIDPLETALREGVHNYLRELLELEVTAALGRLRYSHRAEAKGQRNGHRSRELIVTLGRKRVDVPRTRVVDDR